MKFLALLTAALCLHATAQGVVVAWDWAAVAAADDSTVAGRNTDSPSFNPNGDGGAGISLSTPIGSDITLEVGQSLIYSGSYTVSGTTTSIGAFRFGVFDRNGSSNANNWLGYLALSQADDASNAFFERSGAGNTDFGSNNGAGGATLTTNSTTDVEGTIGDGTYAFSFTITRDTATSYLLDASITGSSYSFTSSARDTTINAGLDAFNHVSITMASNYSADNPASLSNVSVVVVPEPATASLGALALLPLLIARRRTWQMTLG